MPVYSPPSAAGVALYSTASSFGIAPANTAAANKAGFDAAMTAGVSALMCDWTGDVSIDVSAGSIVPTSSVTFVCRSRETKIKCTSPGAVDVIAIKPGTGVDVTWMYGTLEGPTIITGTHVAVGIQNDGTTGTIRVISGAIQKFTWCLRRSPVAVASTCLDVLDSDIAGYGAAFPSTPILWSNVSPGGGTGYLRVQGGSIRNWGDPSLSGLYHGIYTYLDTNLTVVGTRIGGNANSGDAGFGIQIFDGGTTTNANAAKEAVVSSVVFEDGASALSKGIMTGALASHMTKITACTFLNRSVAIHGDGPYQAVNCNFTGFNNASSYCVFLASGAIGNHSTCHFEHGAGAYTIGVTDVNAYAAFHGCDFIQNTGSSAVLGMSAPADSTSKVVFDSKCLFGGVNGNSTIRLDRTVQVIIEGCVAQSTGANSFIYTVTNGTGKSLTLFRNDLSQAGATIFNDTTAPATFRAAQNFGSTGFLTENGGVSTSTPGAVSTVNIAHGLALTPTKFSVQPNNTNARGAPALSVTADATNVIISFASNLTAATSYAWNWRAEYQ